MTTTTSSPLVVCARIAERLAEHIGAQRYNMWFARTAKFTVEEEGDTPRVAVAVPNDFVGDWITKHFDGTIQAIASDEIGTPVDVRVNVTPDQFDAALTGQARNGAPVVTAPRRTRRPANARWQGFDSFVVGRSNELAYAAARRVAEGDPGIASPLFIHGSCGLGKTHLLQAVCRHFQNSHPTASVQYMTAERFTNEFLAALQSKSVGAFQTRMRKLDLLAIDDVQVLGTKSVTQREFLHTLDAMEMDGAQLVMACDQHPRHTREFTEGLISRCIKGMVVEIDEPDTATRARIVESIALRRGINMVPAVIETIAHRCIGSVRDLEGSLTKLDMLAQLSDDKPAGAQRVIGHALVERLFKSESHIDKRRVVTFDNVLDAVADESGITRVQIVGSSRQRDVVLARSLVIYLTRQLTSKSYPEIAGIMGRTSHSTFIAANNRIEEQAGEGKRVKFGRERETVALPDVIERLRLRIVRG